MATLRTTSRPLNRRPSMQWRWRLIALIFLVFLTIGGWLALRLLRPATPAQIVPGQTLAWDIARRVFNSPLALIYLGIPYCSTAGLLCRIVPACAPGPRRNLSRLPIDLPCCPRTKPSSG